MVRVQIAGVSTIEEALFASRVGVDLLGFTLRLPTGLHDGLDEAAAKAIIEVLPPLTIPVVISYPKNAGEAVDLLRATGARVFQFHGDLPPEEMVEFRKHEPWVPRIKAISVTGAEAIGEARKWASCAEALILDTYDPDSGRKGATGKTHDWEISREIVRGVDVPVLLAGGLRPENVREAIKRVRPWGVDAHTGVESRNGRRDRKRIEAFVRTAKEPV